jgi:tight adherence protein C
MDLPLPAFLLALLWSVAAGGIAWYCLRLSTQITYVTLADGRRQERRLPPLFRLLLPLTPNVIRLFEGPRYDQVRRKIDRQILGAGYEGLLTAREFLALRILIPVVAGGFLVVLMKLAFAYLPGKVGIMMRNREWSFFILVIGALAFSPWAWLRGALKERQRSIESALPFVLDLLTLSVEAGLDFMTAIQRIIEKRAIDPLTEELVRVFREVLLGKTRKEALKDMADRVGQDDLNTVVQALVQADELGVSIGSMLRIQAEQMRTRRFQRAEKLANEAPVKMLFPLVAFIFPAVFLVLLGPVLVQILKSGY